MHIAILPLILASLAAAAGDDPPAENPVFKQLVTQGVKMSDGTAVKLRPPVLANGLDAAAQMAAIGKVADARRPLKDLLQDSYEAPVVTRIRTVKESEGEGPTIRAVDVCFVVHGDWDMLRSKGFLESLTSGETGKGHVVLKSGALTDKDMKPRNLSAATTDGLEERFLYTTFDLFDRVRLSATRFSTLTKGEDFILAAGRINPRFDKDAEYPSQWRPLLRDVQANIKPGPAHPFSQAGGYAKVTRLRDPADAAFIEFHLVYEEPYGWFDGVNMVRQKVPVMVQEKVRTFRRKLAVATEEKGQKK